MEDVKQENKAPKVTVVKAINEENAPVTDDSVTEDGAGAFNETKWAQYVARQENVTALMIYRY